MGKLTNQDIYDKMPSKFILSSLVRDRLGKSPQCFWLEQELMITLSNGDVITIPKGFCTDFASVPKWLWGIFPPIGDHNLADLLHDYLYTIKYISKDFCDNEFYTFMCVLRPLKKSRLDNRLRYLAVKLFGKKAFNEID